MVRGLGGSWVIGWLSLFIKTLPSLCTKNGATWNRYISQQEASKNTKGQAPGIPLALQ